MLCYCEPELIFFLLWKRARCFSFDIDHAFVHNNKKWHLIPNGIVCVHGRNGSSSPPSLPNVSIGNHLLHGVSANYLCSTLIGGRKWWSTNCVTLKQLNAINVHTALSHCRNSHRTNGMQETRKRTQFEKCSLFYCLVNLKQRSRNCFQCFISFRFVTEKCNSFYVLITWICIMANMSKHKTTIIPNSTLENGSLRRIQLRAHSNIKYAIIISRHSKLWCPRPSL